MIVLCLFCLELLVCVALGWPIVAALLVGLVLFVGWALRQGYGLRAVGGMLWSGIRTAKNVLIVFLLIGVLTALWRACGTVPLLICYAVDLIHPGTLVITSFLLASAVSALMGTSFGAAATMGAVCMTAAASMGVSPVLAGGAVLSGVFFGDRCSPVSTSALLISELTHTDIYDNLRAMVRTAFVPFALTCAVYAVLGAMAHGGGAARRPKGRRTTLIIQLSSEAVQHIIADAKGKSLARIAGFGLFRHREPVYWKTDEAAKGRIPSVSIAQNPSLCIHFVNIYPTKQKVIVNKI